MFVPCKTAEAMGIASVQTFQQYKHHYKKAHGKSPAWYKIQDGVSYVDIDLFLRYDKIEEACYQYNTNKLYWIFIDGLGISQTELARIISRRSKISSSEGAWNMFISRDMWALPLCNKINPEMTKMVEFTILGTSIVYDIIKYNKSQGNDILTCDIMLPEGVMNDKVKTNDTASSSG